MSSDDVDDIHEHQDFQPTELEHQELFKELDSYQKKTAPHKEVYDEIGGRNKLEFAQEKVKQLLKIAKEYNQKKEQFGNYFDPKLIVEIETQKNNRAGESRFVDDLQNVDIEVISSAESSVGVWYGYTKDEEFKKLKSELKNYENQTYPIFLDFVKDIRSIPPKKKELPNLANNPFGQNENGILDVEIDIIESERSQLRESINNFKEFIQHEDGEFIDEYNQDNLCLVRVRVTKSTLDKILQRGQVRSVGRAPIPTKTREIISESPRQNITIGNLDDKNPVSILIIDSGVVEHPLLVNALGEIDARPTITSTKIRASQPYDEIGHGTRMASIAMYGDIKSCKNQNIFQPEIKIHSSKVMYKNSNNQEEFDPNELLQHQLANAVRFITKKDENCRIINLSIGDSSRTAFKITKQLPLATLIDDLSYENKNLIFVVAAGNIESIPTNPYPNYLLDDNDIVRIIDPATSAHAVTVGAIRDYSETDPNSHNVLHPSSITRIGLGIKEMIKPDLVEFGGDSYQSIMCLNKEFAQSWFTGDYGTSTSAALISNYLGKLCKKFPDASRNLIKALLIASAKIPENDLYPIRSLVRGSGESIWQENLRIYGYGKPNLSHALASENKRVILKDENEIGLGKVQFYTFYLPEGFININGKREISVTLIYDPPVNARKNQYLGAKLDFRLFMNRTLDEVQKDYSITGEQKTAKYEKPKLKSEIKLEPNLDQRSKSIHQKALIKYNRAPGIESDKPLILAIRCTNRWISNPQHSQTYAVVVGIEHSNYTDLYSQIREVNRVRHMTRIKIGSKES